MQRCKLPKITEQKGMEMKTVISIVFFLMVFFHSSVASAALNANMQVYAHDEQITLAYTGVPTGMQNWIGVRRYKDGPGSNRMDVQDGPWHSTDTNSSNIWAYTTQVDGQFVFDASVLSPGRYAAFLLKENGYTWLWSPVIFDIADANSMIDLKVLMFNIWHEGTMVPGGLKGSSMRLLQPMQTLLRYPRCGIRGAI